MTLFLLVTLFTIGLSALCSLLEAMVLSTTPSEVESLKARHAHLGGILEKYKQDLEATSSAILSLNTIANTAGAVISGGLAVQALGEKNVPLFSAALTLAILVFSEVIPKNAGVIYRVGLQPFLILPLVAVRTVMWPVASILKIVIRLFLPQRADFQIDSEEIRLMADRSAKEGGLTAEERNMIANALKLDEVPLHGIMTPRTVVVALERTLTVGELFQDVPNIPFARLPVYEDTIDRVVGLVRRRDLLSEKAADHDARRIEEIMRPILFVPENATASDALQLFLKKHQQFAVVLDEYGSTAGVVTMEDIMESIIGQEIFEPDDPAVDLREFARNLPPKPPSDDPDRGWVGPDFQEVRAHTGPVPPSS